MEKQTALDILKSAILLEQRGRAFYQKVSEQTKNDSVKQFFGQMAEEENHHIHVLSRQYKHYKDNQTFMLESFDDTDQNQTANKILSQDIKDKISSAEFEAAAISAAISMEERAIRLYSRRADETDDAQEKALYQWLADWERGHLNILVDLDKALVEKIWHDNQFWPF